MKLNAKEIGGYFSKLNEAERIYLESLRTITKQLEFIYSKFESDEVFCKYMDIDNYSSKLFVSGDWQYTLLDISRIQAAYIKFKTEDNLKRD